jgi:hypothetical protein
MHDPIGQKHQSIPQLNLYIKKTHSIIQHYFRWTSKKMLLLFHQFQKQFYINIKQMNTNTPKTFKNPKVSTFINTNLTNYKGQDQTFNYQIIYTFKTITWENFKYVQHL